MISIVSCLENQITIVEKVTLDCIYQNASGSVPINTYAMGSIIQTDEYLPFTKELSVCGITLVARDDVSEVLMMRVGQIICELFSIH